MKIALTGATGFVGHYLAQRLAAAGHGLRCWHRAGSDRSGLAHLDDLEWVQGELGQADSVERLLEGCDAVVHAALYRPGTGFRGSEGHLVSFVEKNVIGTLQLIEAARAVDVRRFVFISTCAVHEKILDDRPLDETHPLWATSHYGAHKAAIEKFVHSYGLGKGFPICALRPSGVYGVARPADRSKWYELVAAVVRGENVRCSGGGKEVHAADVAEAVAILLTADGVTGEAFNCYDRYVSDYEVASLAKEISGSPSHLLGEPRQPKHQIVTEKLRRLGMGFGGEPRLRETVTALAERAQQVHA
jgi:nucleoside-diphosphate-sugar epimerase